MACGRPRAKSIQTLRSPHLVQPLQISSSEPSSCQNRRDIQSFANGNLKSEQWLNDESRLYSRLEGAAPILGLVQKDKDSFLSEDEKFDMRETPAGSWHGSTNHDRTPRVLPAHISESPPRISGQDVLPARQDSAYESIRGAQEQESGVDVDIQARNMRARERVEILRGRVFQTRRTIIDCRQGVQLHRKNLRDATDQLMRKLDELMISPTIPAISLLLPLHQAVRTAQDKLGPVEDNYDLLEIRLNREEHELEQEEVHFYTHNNISLSVPPNLDLDKTITPLVKAYQPDTSFPDLDLDNEKVIEYFAKVDEAEQLKDKIDYIENEQYRLTQELAFRARYELKLSEEKSSFLFEFPKTHQDLLSTLIKVEDDIFALRQSCINEHLFTESEYRYEPRDALVDEIDDALNDVLDRNPLRMAAQSAMPQAQQKVNYDDKREYVNTWMLEWVQVSSVETLRLRAFIFLEYGGKMVDEKWPQLALEFWHRDKAGEFANEKHVLSTMDALLGGTGSSGADEGSLDVGLGDIKWMNEDIMGSEAGSFRTQKGSKVEHTRDLAQEVGSEPQIRRSGTITRASSV